MAIQYRYSIYDITTGIEITEERSDDSGATWAVSRYTRWAYNTLTVTTDEVNETWAIFNVYTGQQLFSFGVDNYAPGGDYATIDTFITNTLFQAIGGGGGGGGDTMQTINIAVTDLTVGTDKAQFRVPAPRAGTITEVVATLRTAATSTLAFNLNRYDSAGALQNVVLTGDLDLGAALFASTTNISTATVAADDYFTVDIATSDGLPEYLLIQIRYTPA